MSRSSGQSEARPPVFKSPTKLGIHLSTHCSRDERLSRPAQDSRALLQQHSAVQQGGNEPKQKKWLVQIQKNTYPVALYIFQC
ncbi:hypothetical protein TNCV_3186791 [Trichonephila clavipes]|nr:hypothetical protein TNCV_3186791 [Trichonephila clavipes]